MNLIEDLALGYERWQSANCRRSIAVLARLSDVHYQTLRRIVQREVGETRFETAMAIASVIFDRDELMHFARLHFGAAGKWLERWSLLAREPEPLDAQSFFLQVTYRKIIILADTSDGIDREMLQKKMGEDGLARLAELLEARILIDQQGRIRIADAHRRLALTGPSHTHLSILLELLETHRSESPYRQMQFFANSGLNEEGILLLQKILLKMHEEVLVIHSDPLLRGNIPSIIISAQGCIA